MDIFCANPIIFHVMQREGVPVSSFIRKQRTDSWGAIFDILVASRIVATTMVWISSPSPEQKDFEDQEDDSRCGVDSVTLRLKVQRSPIELTELHCDLTASVIKSEHQVV